MYVSCIQGPPKPENEYNPAQPAAPVGRAGPPTNYTLASPRVARPTYLGRRGAPWVGFGSFPAQDWPVRTGIPRAIFSTDSLSLGLIQSSVCFGV